MKVGIVGAGLAGLSCGIQLLQEGAEVHIFEKSSIPSLKVCGEYLSLEVLPKIEQLGIQIEYTDHPFVDHLTASGKSQYMKLQLPLGGIGISRQVLDSAFKNRFLAMGGILYEKTNIKSLATTEIQTAQNDSFSFDQIINASGRLNPFRETTSRGKTYTAFKKHVPLADWPINRIHLDFHDWGYIGFNGIENGLLCVCSLVDQAVLKAHKSLPAFESTVQNIHPSAEPWFRVPGKTVAVSNFTFHPYGISTIPAIGDAGGNVPPLSGNGMSLAIQAGMQWAEHILTGSVFETSQTNTRIKAGLALNSLSMSPFLDVGLRVFNYFTGLTQQMVALTHGKP